MKKYVRSATYREEFINAHPGWHGLYMCVYCGKIIPKKKMQVDHVVAINRLNKNILYRPLVGTDGVNALQNLVASCQRCNGKEKKADKGGVWIVRGKIGGILFPIIWAVTIFALVCLLVLVFVTHSITPELIRSEIGHLLQTARLFFTQFIQGFLAQIGG